MAQPGGNFENGESSSNNLNSLEERRNLDNVNIISSYDSSESLDRRMNVLEAQGNWIETLLEIQAKRQEERHQEILERFDALLDVLSNRHATRNDELIDSLNDAARRTQKYLNRVVLDGFYLIYNAVPLRIREWFH